MCGLEYTNYIVEYLLPFSIFQFEPLFIFSFYVGQNTFRTKVRKIPNNKIR